VMDFHRSMIRFYRKHHASKYPAVFNAGIYTGVLARMCLVMGVKTLKGWS